VRIELFGSLQITCGEQNIARINTNRLRSLVAFLVLHIDSAQTREQLAFRLWPESSESQARTNLRQLLHHLRRALPADCCLLAIDNHTVRWRRDSSCSIDVVEFDAAVAQAGIARQLGNADHAFYYGLLAEACAAASRAGEGLANVAIGFAFQSKNGETWASWDVHRIQGDLLLQSGDREQAKASYQRALEAARQTSSRLFELRAATRLCRLRSSADDILALEQVFRSCSEGSETEDLRESSRLLVRGHTSGS